MISIAICTYNRASQLEVLLKNMTALQEEWREQFEILVVDNGSTDHTAGVVESFLGSLPLRLLQETKTGLSHARNKALAEFSGEAIWFLDDDTLISKQTVEAYRRALRMFPKVQYFGGPIDVDWQGQKPWWLREEELPILDGLFGIYNQGANDQYYQSSVAGPHGANFVLRRALIEVIGEFDPEFGVRGQHIGRGEESEYFARVVGAQLSGMYVSGARVGHRFQLDRLSLGYLWRYGLEKGRAEVLLHGRRDGAWLGKAAKQLILGIWQLVKMRLDRFYQCWINIGIARGRYLASKTERDRTLVGGQ